MTTSSNPVVGSLDSELLEAARFGESELVVELLDAGAQVNAKDFGGSTPLHRACANGHLECVKILIQNGAKHTPNDSGNLPLHWAVQNKHQEVVRLLLESYPDIDVLARNSFGKGSLTEAFLTNETELVAMLLSHSSASEEKLTDGKTDLEGVKIEDEESESDANDQGVDTAVVGPSGSRVIQQTVLELKFLPSQREPIKIRELGLDWDGDAFGSEAQDDTTGISLWSASLILSRWILSRKETFAGAKVIELGAGCGLPGIVAGRVAGASHVLLTDLMDHTLKNLEHNVTLNGPKPAAATKPAIDACVVCQCTQRFTPDNPQGKLMKCGRCRAVAYCSKDCQKRHWPSHKKECGKGSNGDRPAELRVQAVDWVNSASWPEKEACDIIIGSDLIYHESLIEPLCNVINHVLRAGGKFYYVASQERQGLTGFENRMSSLGLDCSKEEASESLKANPLINVSPDLFDLHFSEMSDTYYLYEFSKK